MSVFLKTGREKLQWIATRNIDPKRSQLRKSAPLEILNIVNKYYKFPYIVWYDELAYEFQDELDEDEVELVGNFLYDDVVKHNLWGYII